MILWILLLIKLISCVCVNVTQTSYKAEENHNIVLEWTFTTKPDTPTNSLSIFCELLTELKPLGLYHLHDGVEVSESQDQHFSGRVKFDKDVLREGRIRLHLSRLRTEDSGLYLCVVSTDGGWSSDTCQLNVTMSPVRDWIKPVRETEKEPERESEGSNTARQERIGLYCGLGLTAAALLSMLYFALINSLPKKQYFYSSNGSEETV